MSISRNRTGRRRDRWSDTFEDGGRRGLYRSRDGMIFGVIKGWANYADLSAGWLRVIFIVLALLTWIWPMIIVYIAAALIMKPEPGLEPRTEEDLEFYNSYASSRTMALSRLKKKFEQLERRTRRMESIVTNKEFDWEQRLNTES